MASKTALVLVPMLAIAALAAIASADEVISSEEILQQLAPPRPKLLSPRKPRTRGIGVEPAPAAATASAPASTEFRRIALPAIQFEFDSDRLTGVAARQLGQLAQALEAPALRAAAFSIQGHTDSTGAAAYNRTLSLRRAQAVKRHLVAERGLAAARLVEAGLGEAFPLSAFPSDDGRNRRVEIVHLGIEVPPAGGERSQGRSPNRRALIIGIDRYRHVSPLEGPVNDAAAMASFLAGSLGYRSGEIKTLLDREATRHNILAAIENWLVAGTAPGDEAFLFFSGHGFQQPDTDGDEADRRDETLVPVDAFVDEKRTVVGMITDDEIATLLDRMSGRRIHVVLDSCHSGTATRSTGDWRQVKSPRLPDGTPLRLAPRTRGVGGAAPGPREAFLSSDRPELTVWTAVRAEQKALVDEEASGAPGSVFTRLFLRGARDGEADRDADGAVATQELHDYLVAGSEAYCRRHLDVCGAGLTPQLFAAPVRLDKPALPPAGAAPEAAASRESKATPRLSRVARLAKDILVRSPEAGESETGVRLQMDPGARIALGTMLDIVVESDRDGYLVVIDVDAAGRLVQIFPNERSLASGVSDRVRAGQRVVLPGESAGFRFRAEPPLGRGALIAVVSAESVPLRSLAARHKDLSVVPHPESYLVELAEVLRGEAAASGQDGNDAGWEIARLDYQIVPQQY